MTKDVAKICLERIALCDWHMDNFYWDEDNFTDGEIEYQVRDYSNGDFCSILVRFCDDITHTYREFFAYEYEETPSDIFYDALDGEVVERLTESVNRKYMQKVGLIS